MATTMEFCTQQTYARMGVLDTLCAIRAARPHAALPFQTPERVQRWQGIRGLLFGSAGPLAQVQNGLAHLCKQRGILNRHQYK